MNSQLSPPAVKPTSLDVSVAGWFLLIASLWELIFNRLFAALGIYNNVGAIGILSFLAASGRFAMNATGIMALILTCILLPRMASDPKLGSLPARIILMLASPLYLPVVCVAVFRPISPALILIGYLIATCSMLFLSVLVAVNKLDSGRRRIILALAFIQSIVALGLITSTQLSDFSHKAYMLAEALFLATPVFAFFIYLRGRVISFIKRPHLPALVFAIVATGFATAVTLVASSKTPVMLILVAFRSLGLTMNVPGGALLYLIVFFFGTILAGTLLLPSKVWPPSPTLRRAGIGLVCIWVSGIQPTHPYQFILVMTGFLYLARSMIETERSALG